MIYEIASISSFFILVIILILSTFLHSICKKNLKRIPKRDKSTLPQNRLRLLKNLTVISILLLLFNKLTIFLFAPDTILNFDPIAPEEINYLIINFFYAIFWIMVILSFYISNDVKDEYLMNFLQKLSVAIVILFFFDFCLTGLIYIINIRHYFNLAITIPKFKLISTHIDTKILLSLILVLLMMMVVLFTIFIIKRRIRLLRYYELNILFLLATVGYLLLANTSHLIGWNESVFFRLKLFSIEYGFTGLLFLILLAVTLITNTFVILLFNLKEIFNNSMMLKNRIINHMKIGFIATFALCGLALMPHFILWFY